MAVRTKGWATTAIWGACMALFAVLHLGNMVLMLVLIGPLAVALGIYRLLTGAARRPCANLGPPPTPFGCREPGGPVRDSRY